MGNKVIRIVGHSKEMLFPFGENGPWKLYADRFIESGFTIAGLEPTLEITHLVAHSHSKEAILEAERCGVPLSNRILVIWEPAVVDEKVRSKKILKLYGTVIYASKHWAKENGEKFFRWPQSIENFEKIAFEDWKNRENSAVMIQANKYSIHKDEMYSLRRAVIKEFDDSSQCLALYGSHWDAGIAYNLRSWIASSRRIRFINWNLNTCKYSVTKYLNYLGKVGNKNEINSRYRISIVIENSLDYVSEKLFDASAAGTYVVYLGPDLKQFDLDSSQLNNASRDAAGIKEIVNNFLARSSFAQYELMSLQRDSIINDFRNHDNNRVLAELAAHTISSFEDD